MRRQPDTRRADRVIAWFARRQHGTVARWQLLEAGLTERQIRTRLERSQLAELHRGVYLVGSVRPTHAHEMAALLAFRLKAVLSHRSAARHWELSSHSASAPVWVTVPANVRSERAGIKTVRAAVAPTDIRRRHGIRLTSPPRTILDMAGLIGEPYELERLTAEAHYRGLASEAELRGQVQRNPGKPGVRALREVLDMPGGPRRTRSLGERALLKLLRTNGIAGFDTNVTVLGHEVDFLFTGSGLIVELDGWDGHSSRPAFERDRLKWATLQAAHYRVMPVTGRQLRDDPSGVIARIVAAKGEAR